MIAAWSPAAKVHGLVALMVIPWFELRPWHVPLPFGATLPIQPFGVLAALAIVLGSRIALARAERTGVPRQLVADFIAHTVGIGLLSCIVLNVLVYEPHKLAQMARAIGSWFLPGERVAFPYPGLSSFGGFFGAVLAAFWFRRRRNVSLLVLSDSVCYALPFAWIVARTGCFVVHDHPGVASDFFLAVDDYHRQGVPRHDLGLYEVILSIVIAAVFHRLGRSPRRWGFFPALLILMYAPVRFALDFLRETPEHGGDVRYLGFTPGQYASLLMLLLGVGIALRVARGPSPPRPVEAA